MKIIYAARFDNEGISSNTSQARGLQKLGHEVIMYSTPHRQEEIGFEACDNEIIAMVEKEKPDLFIIAKGTGINLRVFKECRQITPIAYWFPDPLVTYDNPEFIEKTRCSDYFCCDKENVLQKALEYNPNCYLVPDGFDADLEYPKDLDQDIDVCFIGNLYGDRKEKIEALKHNVTVISDAYGPRHSEIVSRSKININFCTTAGASDRTYKVLGAKGFFLSDDWVGREKTFKDNTHLVLFDTLEDLDEKIAYYLGHPQERDQIREQGYQEVQKFTRDEWARKVIVNFETESRKNNFFCTREKVLIAGPWVGEFGWELFAWHGYIRSLSAHYDKTIIMCRKTSQALYEDFADEFVFYEASDGLADSFFMHQHKIDHTALQQVFKTNEMYNVTWLPPRRVGNPPHTPLDSPQAFGKYQITPLYVDFGKDCTPQKHVVIHARNRKLRQDDNWPLSDWEKLVELLKKDGYTIFSIGTLEQASHIVGTIDKRGCELKETFQLLGKAEAIFGPSSGPMHLASLCGCPQVVWSKPSDFTRYTQNWNPHKTPVLFLGEHEWRPSPQFVHTRFKETW